VFGSLYIMSPCCLAPRPPPNDPELQKKIEAAKSGADLDQLPFWVRVQLASAAAWSPNPANPPWFSDLPTRDGQPRPEVLEKWNANAPLAFIDQYVMNLRSYRAISIDVGDQDGLRTDTTTLHEVLDRYQIAHGFEIYSGTHTSRVADRFQNHVLPFFGKTLCLAAKCP